MLLMAVGNAHDVRFTPLAAAASMTRMMFFMVVGNAYDFMVVGNLYDFMVVGALMVSRF